MQPCQIFEQLAFVRPTTRPPARLPARPPSCPNARNFGNPGIWESGNPEIWNPTKSKTWNFSKSQSVLPKMLARSRSAGKNTLGPVLGHFRPFFHGANKCQNLYEFAVSFGGRFSDRACTQNWYPTNTLGVEITEKKTGDAWYWTNCNAQMSFCPNRLNSSHWPTKENRQKIMICFVALFPSMEKLVWNCPKWCQEFLFY